MDWTALIEALFAAFEKCQEDDDDVIVERVRRPRDDQRRAFERQLRIELGLSPLQWFRQGRGIMKELEAERDSMTPDELKKFIAQRKAA